METVIIICALFAFLVMWSPTFIAYKMKNKNAEAIMYVNLCCILTYGILLFFTEFTLIPVVVCSSMFIWLFLLYESIKK